MLMTFLKKNIAQSHYVDSSVPTLSSVFRVFVICFHVLESGGINPSLLAVGDYNTTTVVRKQHGKL